MCAVLRTFTRKLSRFFPENFFSRIFCLRPTKFFAFFWFFAPNFFSQIFYKKIKIRKKFCFFGIFLDFEKKISKMYFLRVGSKLMYIGVKIFSPIAPGGEKTVPGGLKYFFYFIYFFLVSGKMDRR